MHKLNIFDKSYFQFYIQSEESIVFFQKMLSLKRNLSNQNK